MFLVTSPFRFQLRICHMEVAFWKSIKFFWGDTLLSWWLHLIDILWATLLLFPRLFLSTPSSLSLSPVASFTLPRPFHLPSSVEALWAGCPLSGLGEQAPDEWSKHRKGQPALLPCRRLERREPCVKSGSWQQGTPRSNLASLSIALWNSTPFSPTVGCSGFWGLTDGPTVGLFTDVFICAVWLFWIAYCVENFLFLSLKKKKKRGWNKQILRSTPPPSLPPPHTPLWCVIKATCRHHLLCNMLIIQVSVLDGNQMWRGSL